MVAMQVCEVVLLFSVLIIGLRGVETIPTCTRSELSDDEKICYKFHPEPAMFRTAQSECRVQDGDLAICSSAAELTKASRFVNTTYSWFGLRLKKYIRYPPIYINQLFRKYDKRWFEYFGKEPNVTKDCGDGIGNHYYDCASKIKFRTGRKDPRYYKCSVESAIMSRLLVNMSATCSDANVRLEASNIWLDASKWRVTVRKGSKLKYVIWPRGKITLWETWYSRTDLGNLQIGETPWEDKCQLMNLTNVETDQPHWSWVDCDELRPFLCRYKNFDLQIPTIEPEPCTAQTSITACEPGTLTITCQDEEEIDVVGASFGRSEPYVCNKFSSAMNEKCHSPNSLTAVRDRCRYQRACSVSVTTEVFGDPCPEVNKYLSVQYRCCRKTVSRGATRGAGISPEFPR